jgi:small subunit ribosomal protein S17
MAETVERKSQRKVRTGTVVSNKMDKTIVVRLQRTRSHPLYKKTFRETSKLYAHDEKNEANVGDLVRVMETRRLSAAKRWRLLDILERAK